MFQTRIIVSFLFFIQLVISNVVYSNSIFVTDSGSSEMNNYSLSASYLQSDYLNDYQVLNENRFLKVKSESISKNYLNPKSYHKYSGDESENVNVLGMFLLAGYGKLRYNIYEKAAYTMDYSFVKGGGVSYEIPLEAFDGKFSVYNELGFSLFKSQAKLHFGDTIGGDPVNNYYDVNLTFAPNSFFFSNTLRYCLTKSDFKYYVSIGISNSFVVSSTNTKETLHTTNGSTERYVDEFVPDPAVYGITVLVTTGFSYKNIGFEMRFDSGRNYSNKIHYAVYMPSFLGILHVRFNPK